MFPGFHPAVRRWFETAFPNGPTRAQAEGWPLIARGESVLVEAPTGSGKTLAAFLSGIDVLLKKAEKGELGNEVSLLYISPLKALDNDVKRNLEEPLRAIVAEAAKLGVDVPPLRSAVRTGDTSPSERRSIVTRPPHVLITTPESLYLLLTAEQGRKALASVETVIVDEVHAVLASKRGAHLALSLERLQALTGKPLQRIGLSATVEPIDEVARFLMGLSPDGKERPCAVVAAGRGRPLDLEVLVPTPSLGAVATTPVWDAVYDRIAELARTHRTTICFMKSRRHVERTGLRLRERLGKTAVATHHGSLSLKQRRKTERRLKAGELSVVVATGSLELGIDVGSIDLVVGVESPGSVATLLQRVGRSGHAVGATSKGRLLPLTLDDLVEAAAIVRAAREGKLDRTRVPRGGLDVLAQQVVAECAARDEAKETELLAIARGAYPYRETTREDLEQVLALHAERPLGAPRGSFPLLHRDKPRGIVRARRAARLVAIGSGGAIPDRANFDVIWEARNKKIGDLDEDFSVESMAGDVFVLGSHAWQITKIRTGKVYVRDAKGKHPTIPFWRGDAPGRTWDLSHDTARLRSRIGARLDHREALETELRSKHGLDEHGARVLCDYVAAGKAALGLVPDEKTVVCERFFDNTGGTQLVLHSPFGMRVNKAWGLALRKRFCKTFDFELQAAATDDAILLSLGPRQALPPDELTQLLPAKAARKTLEQAILQAPIFETLFRWNATRSLAVPRQMGGKRVPAPVLRLRAGDLLASAFPAQVACFENRPVEMAIPDHPIVKESIREALEDTYDLAHLEEVLAQIHSGMIKVVGRETASPSPFAHEILAAWGYAFLDDAPLEERRARAVTTHRSLLQGAVESGLEALLDRKLALALAKDSARADEKGERRARDARELLFVLDEAGSLREDELLASAPDLETGRAWLSELRAEGSALEREIRGETRLVASSFLETIELAYGEGTSVEKDRAQDEVLRRRLSRMPPSHASEIALETRLSSDETAASLARLEAAGEILRGRFTRTGEDELALRNSLERLHQRTLSRLRKRAQPVSRNELARFLLRWQRCEPAKRRLGAEGLLRTVEQLEGLSLPASEWERAVLPCRVEGSVPSLLDSLGLSGEIVWARIEPPRKKDQDGNAPEDPLLRGPGPIAIVLRDDLPWLRRPQEDENATLAALSDEARALLEHLRARGASFVAEIARALSLPESRALVATAELVRAGLATGDGFALLRALDDRHERKAARKRAAFDRKRGLRNRSLETSLPGKKRLPGRVALLDTAPPSLDEDEVAELRARALLARWGVLAREMLEHEPCFGSWGEIATVLRRLEARQSIRRGLFAHGLSGEQYALPEAVERLRLLSRIWHREKDQDAAPIVLAAVDPLASFIAFLDERAPRVARVAGSKVVVAKGRIAAAKERGEVRIFDALATEEDRRRVEDALGSSLARVAT